MAESNGDEEERMREAIRLAKKWKRIEMPLAVVVVFLTLVISLTLDYVFQLSPTMVGIIGIVVCFSIGLPPAFYYGRKIEKLSGYETKLKWDPIPGAKKEAVVLIVSGVASLSFILLGALTGAGESLAYSITGVGLFCGVVIPLGNRIARKRHMVNRERLPPSRRKAADEIFEILVYGEKKEDQRNNSTT
ncbi:MAG: hypothetical protein QXF52_11455 [Thermoproteota archaeon]